MLFHIMDAGKLVRTARLRKGLTQRQLATRAKIPQPMLSSIERGHQDPRYSTLERLLAACGQELDIFPRAGEGVDRTQFVESLGLSPAERLARVGEGARWLRKVRRARRVG
jgi:transcriptional regulator with XRE-family HTH domain